MKEWFLLVDGHELITFVGNVELNWPKLFQAFFVKVTLIFYHQCVHSIIPHQHIIAFKVLYKSTF